MKYVFGTAAVLATVAAAAAVYLVKLGEKELAAETQEPEVATPADETNV